MITWIRSRWTLPVGFLIIFATLTVSRHLWLASWSYDLGVKAQLLANCAAGRWCESSFEVQRYFGDHLNPTFLLLTPLYALAPSPVTLILAQCTCVALGGVLIGELARIWLPKRPGAMMLAQLVFLFHASTQNMVLYDVHENAFAATLVLAAVLAVERKRLIPFLICTLLAVGCKENGGMAAAALGTWLLLRNQFRALGCALIVLGPACSFVAIQFIMPHFRGEFPDSVQRYAELGADPADILRNLLRNPLLALPAVLTAPKIVYLLVLFIPTLFVPFLSPRWLLPVFWVLLPNILSARPQQFSSIYHYDALIIPFIVLAMLRAWTEPLARDNPRLLDRFIPRATIAALIILCANSRILFWAGEARRNVGRLESFTQIAAKIPPHASLSASLNLGPHLIRRQLQVFPERDWPEDRFPDLPVRRAEFVLVDYDFERHHHGHEREPQQDTLIEDGYSPVAETDGFALYRLTPGEIDNARVLSSEH